MSILLERNIVVNDLPSEANLLHSLDSVLWYIVRWCFRTLLIFIVCLSHVAAPLSQSRIVQITPWNIEVSKFLFELKEFIVQSSNMLTAHDFLASLPSISSTRTHYTNLPYFRQTLALTFLFFSDANWVEDRAIDWRCFHFTFWSIILQRICSNWGILFIFEASYSSLTTDSQSLASLFSNFICDVLAQSSGELCSSKEKYQHQ
jgi:hypothetical protein